jgi:hypothetical protein
MVRIKPFLEATLQEIIISLKLKVGLLVEYKGTLTERYYAIQY